MKDYLKKVLIEMPQKNASDLHISALAPLHYRINGELMAISNDGLSEVQAKEMVYSMLSGEQIKRFEDFKELDFSFEIEGIGRYRANAFLQRGRVGCAIRLIPMEVWPLSKCGLPEEVVMRFCAAQKGLVLVTGATGSGKSTTLATILDIINRQDNCHIVTVEDPIEFIHTNKKALVEQRQLHEDTFSFSNALKFVLRQDPDVILIGELRDLDTIQQALIIADTGHLVLGTLHTSDSIQTINRIVDVFPAHQQRQVRTQLSFCLLGIIAQQLIPRSDVEGLVLAAEILVATPAVRSMIRDEKEHQIYSVIQTSQKYGMKTMNQSLSELYLAGKISKEDALARSSNEEELAKMI